MTERLTEVSVTTAVSEATSVWTLVAVTTTVDAGAVLPIVTVTVSASMPRQLHALESLEAGWWTRFLLARVGQLRVAEEETVRFFMVGTTVKSLVVVVDVVEVTVTSSYSVLVVTESISAVVVLSSKDLGQNLHLVARPGFQHSREAYVNSVSVVVSVEVKRVVTVTTGYAVSTTVTGTTASTPM
jgi:hypothetical protein